MQQIKITSALISVFHKKGLEQLVPYFKEHHIKIYSTGGTQAFLEEHGLEVIPVEEITGYPSIFGGRVKTLHPAVFGSILFRRGNPSDQEEQQKHEIPQVDLVIVDLYPFEETVASGASREEIIEKIDIGGISLIRAAAKNYTDVVVVSDRGQYQTLLSILSAGAETTQEQRQTLAAEAFAISSHYDTQIFNYLNQSINTSQLRISSRKSRALRYGENPHQQGWFYGDLEKVVEQLHGKALSYNNLVDLDACVAGLADCQEYLNAGLTACIIIKHTNACGWALAKTPASAYAKAFAADTISAFGGVIGFTSEVDVNTAEQLDALFFELLVAPSYETEALEILRKKKNRMILQLRDYPNERMHYKSALGGMLAQEYDAAIEKNSELSFVSSQGSTVDQQEDLLFASMVAKHTKSNTIVLVKDLQLIGSGMGQTSRVDAARQAIEKAGKFNFTTEGSVMASDAFFPFPDTVELAAKAGIAAIVQPGGSVKDDLSIEAANKAGIAMVFTGRRHFKH